MRPMSFLSSILSVHPSQHISSPHNLGPHSPAATSKHHTSKLPSSHIPVGPTNDLRHPLQLPLTMPFLHTSTFIRRSPAECREIVSVFSLKPNQSTASHPIRSDVKIFLIVLLSSCPPIARPGRPSTTANGKASCQHAADPSWRRSFDIAWTSIEPQVMNICLSTSRVMSK